MLMKNDWVDWDIISLMTFSQVIESNNLTMEPVQQPYHGSEDKRLTCHSDCI